MGTMNPIVVNKEKCIGCGKIPQDSAEKASAVKDSVTGDRGRFSVSGLEKTIDASRAGTFHDRELIRRQSGLVPYFYDAPGRLRG